MTRMRQLAINDEGFVFDPTTGESFTCNKTGLVVLRGLKEGKDQAEISLELSEQFEVDADDAERDVFDFVDNLRVFKIASS